VGLDRHVVGPLFDVDELSNKFLASSASFAPGKVVTRLDPLKLFTAIIY